MLGAVLAGGRSRRFGSDKAVALLGGERLIDRVLATLAPQVAATIVCGRDLPDATCVPDRPHADLGPLGGLCGALHHARAHGYDAVVSVPCDAPALPGDLVARLGGAGACAYVATSPVIGLWPVGLADKLDRHLAGSDDRAMRGWAALARAVALDVAGIANINTPADLARLSPLPLPRT